MVCPACAKLRKVTPSAATAGGSSWAVGSSRINTGGLRARAAAMTRRCCWPPESWNGERSAKWVISINSMARCTRWVISAMGNDKFCRAKPTSSATLKQTPEIWVLAWLVTIVTWGNISMMLLASGSRPSTCRLPLVLPRKNCGMKPASKAHNVLLPAPALPIMAVTLPGFRANDTAAMAGLVWRR